MGNQNAVGKKGNGKLGNLAIVFVSGSFFPVDYFVLCASISVHTYTRAEHVMPKSAAGSQSSPYPRTSLLWRTSIAAFAASSASIYNVVHSGLRDSYVQQGFQIGGSTRLYVGFSTIVDRRRPSGRRQRKRETWWPRRPVCEIRGGSDPSKVSGTHAKS